MWLALKRTCVHIDINHLTDEFERKTPYKRVSSQEFHNKWEIRSNERKLMTFGGKEEKRQKNDKIRPIEPEGEKRDKDQHLSQRNKRKEGLEGLEDEKFDYG